MELDNPSYFSFPNYGSQTLPGAGRGRFGQIQRPTNLPLVEDDRNTYAGAKPRTNRMSPAKGRMITNRRNKITLRSFSVNAVESNPELFIHGEPRPADIAPPSPTDSFSLSDIFMDKRSSTASVAPSVASATSSGSRSSSITSKSIFNFDVDERKKPSRASFRSDGKKTVHKDETELLLSPAMYYNVRRHSFGTGSLAVTNTHGNYGRSCDFKFLDNFASGLVDNDYETPNDRREMTVDSERSRFPTVHSEGPYKTVDFVNAQAVIHATCEGQQMETPVTTPISINSDCVFGRDEVDSSVRVDDGTSASGWKECSRKKSNKTKTMEEIAIIYSRDSSIAIQTVDYLTTLLNEQPTCQFKIVHVKLEELIPGMEDRYSLTKLQILVVCPTALHHLSDLKCKSSYIYQMLLKFLAPSKVIAVHVNLNDEHRVETYKAVLPHSHTWKQLIAGSDDNWPIEFVKITATILNSADVINPVAKTQFKVHPKKVQTGQRRLLITLDAPVSTEDVVKVKIITDEINSNTGRTSQSVEVVNVKRRNPYALQVTIPEKYLELSALIHVVVERNFDELGRRPVKCESRLRELDQILRAEENPLDFICQTIGITSSSREELDNFLLQTFQRNLPPHFNLFTPGVETTLFPSTHAYKNVVNEQRAVPEMYPTLLHFAARFGFEMLAWRLLDCPGGEQACTIANYRGLTPDRIAEKSGYHRLAHVIALRGKMQLNEFCNMYQVFKGMSGKEVMFAEEADEKNDGYISPRPFVDTYSVPPAARPLDRCGSEDCNVGYMEMSKSSGKVQSRKAPSLPSINDTTHQLTTTTPIEVKDCFKMHPNPVKLTTFKPDLKKINPISKSALGTPSDATKRFNEINELTDNSSSCRIAQVIDELKNDAAVQQTVDRITEVWELRNDARQSFADRHEKLCKTHEEYQRIQARVPIFDRIRSIFMPKKLTKTVTLTSGSSCDLIAKLADDCRQISLRPISSLSSQSSSSSTCSTRMSTGSSTSTADSGTQSDVDERKHLLFFPTSGDDMSNSSFNYSIPPPPQPVCKVENGDGGKCAAKLEWQFVANEKKTQNNLALKQFQSGHYILCPPSGLPVNGNFELTQIRENESTQLNESNHDEIIQTSFNETLDYMNFHPIATNKHDKTCDSDSKSNEDDDNDGNKRLHHELNEIHEYMNFTPARSDDLLLN